MKKKALLIINPIAGTHSKEGIEEKVRARLEPAGFEVEKVFTEYAGHGARLAASAAADGYYCVLSAGGDGTVNEIASALRSTTTALGILPLGSGNGLARHIYGSIDVDHALDVIARDHPVACDYGTVNGRPFFCTFGLGFDAAVSDDYAHAGKRGLTTYVSAALHEWHKYKAADYEITVDGETFHAKAFVLAVGNASQYGNNAYIAPHASVRDGMLDLVLIDAHNPLTQARVGLDLFAGTIDRNVHTRTIRFSEATIRQMPAPAHVDGEPCTMPEVVNVKCHSGAIRIMADPEKPAFTPFLTLFRAIRDDSRYHLREGSKHVVEGIKHKLFNKK